jgi:uroporphyrinogen III methyltransferase/synthase
MAVRPPLAGKRVLVTRAREQAPPLVQGLTDAGAEVVAFPTIEVRRLPDAAPLDRAVTRLGSYSWIAFTSVNSVRFFWQRLAELGTTLPKGIRVAAVGSATARALTEMQVRVDAVPTEFTGDHLATRMGEVSGSRILLPRAVRGREALAMLLRERGATVDDLAIYESVAAVPTPEALARLAPGLDAATFTSGSAVKCFVELTGGNHRKVLGGAVVACIGPFTAAAARTVGLTVPVEPAEHTIPGLVRALVAHYDNAAKALLEPRG